MLNRSAVARDLSQDAGLQADVVGDLRIEGHAQKTHDR